MSGDPRSTFSATRPKRGALPAPEAACLAAWIALALSSSSSAAQTDGGGPLLPSQCTTTRPLKLFIDGSWQEMPVPTNLKVIGKSGKFVRVESSLGIGKARAETLARGCRRLRPLQQQPSSVVTSELTPAPPEPTPPPITKPAASVAGSCLLSQDLKVFREGRWTSLSSGTQVYILRRGPTYSVVMTPTGTSSASNAVVEKACGKSKPALPARLALPRCRDRDAQHSVLLAKKRIRTLGEEGVPDAATSLRGAIAKEPDCAEAWWELGRAHHLAGDVDSAVKAWTELEKLAPRLAGVALVQLAITLQHNRMAALRALPALALRPVQEQPAPGASVRVAGVGDIHLGRGGADPPVLPPNGGKEMFTGVTDVLQAPDLTFGNLETALADAGESIKCGDRPEICFAFRAPTQMALRLKEAGIDVVSLANNHAADYGMLGLQSTMAALEGAEVLYAGMGRTAVLERKGLKIAVVAFSTYRGGLRVQDLELARRVVAHLDQENDIVVVSYHAGAEGPSARRVPKAVEEYLGEDRGDVYAFSHAVVDAGADVGFGHGPHVFRGMEVYRSRVIAYSLGNFSSWKTFAVGGHAGLTGVVDVELARNGVPLSAHLHPVRLEKSGRPAPDGQSAVIRSVRELSYADFGNALFDLDGSWRPGAGLLVAHAQQPLDVVVPTPAERTCVLARPAKAFQQGRWVPLRRGTVLEMGPRGDRFTAVQVQGSPARVANALLERSCH